MKKIISVILATVLLFSVAVCPMTAGAILTAYSGMLTALPGNTRSSSPVYNYAWLDNVVVRDDATAVVSATLVPVTNDGYGSHTYDEFIKEASQYSVLFDVDENTVAAAYTEITNTLYYVVVAMGMTDELPVMRQYIQDYGIRLPNDETPTDKAQIAVVYAALKYDAVYALYEKKTEIPVGTTLEGALVIIISALTGTMLPSGVETLTGLAVNTVKTYVEQFEQIPLSENPGAEEVFHWAKVITAASNDYQVPLAAFDVATDSQKQYVDYAYYATIINTVYDITVNPIYLIIAEQSDDELAVQKLILQTMLDEKEVSYDYEMGTEELFELANANGCFALEDEFYSDVLTYEITVAEDCEKLWFTPFVLAGQLEGGNDDFVSIVIGDTVLAHSATVGVPLNPNLKQEEITMSVAYVDSTRNDNATYVFTVKKDASLNSNESSGTSNDLVADVENFVNSIVPTDNEKVSQIVDNVFSAVDNQVDNLESQVDNGVLTTFNISGDSGQTDVTDATNATNGYSGYNFDYLDDLFAGVYATDADGNIVTTTSFFNYTQPTEESSFIENITNTVKENPEIIVAPTSLITLGSIAGFVFSKKQRSSVLDEDDESEKDSDNE